MAIDSKSSFVRMMTNFEINIIYLVMGRNVGLMETRLRMDVCYMAKV